MSVQSPDRRRRPATGAVAGSPGPGATTFTVAGALTLAHDGAQVEDRAFGGPQPRLVAAMLLVDRDRAWSSEQLAEQLWPSGRPERRNVALSLQEGWPWERPG